MLQIIYKKANTLIPYVNNSRTHSDAQVQQIASSLKEFGWTNPILIDEDNSIIAGHGRLRASQLLGMEEVPTILVSDLTPEQKKAYVIADNKLALNAGWDEELLKLELQSLDDLVDHTLLDLTGFDSSEIEMLINGWQSNIEHLDALEAKDSADKKKIVIKVPAEFYDETYEAVSNAVWQIGSDDIEIS